MARKLVWVYSRLKRRIDFRPARTSSTERTGPGFSAFKASAGRPAQKNATSDVISSQPIACLHETGHVFSPTSHEVYHVIHRTRRSEVHSLHSRLLWFQFLVPVIHLQRTGTDFSATDISRPVSLRLLWYEERTPLVRAYPRSWSRDFPTSSRSWSSSPISQSRCPSDQQAGHVTHRPTFVSKYSSQGFSQQLSKSTNKTCVPRNTFINGGNLQPAEFYTKDSCKLFQQLVTECTDQYRLYSLVHLLQQPVTEELMEKIEFNTVKIVVNFIQQLVTQCTYWLHSLVHLLQKTGYRVCRPTTGWTALYTYFNNWLQYVPTGYRLHSLIQ